VVLTAARHYPRPMSPCFASSRSPQGAHCSLHQSH
jgi:hypothetical protein